MPAQLNLDAHGSTFPLGDKKTLSFGPLAFRGDLCEIYRGTLVEPATRKKGGTRFDRMGSDDGEETAVLLKVAANPVDDDLVTNEAEKLGKLFPPGTPDEKMFRYLPRLLGSFSATLRGVERRANLLLAYPRMPPLNIVHEVYPSGLDFRDVVWMFKRLLVVVGFAHDKGLVHNAVLPPHVIVDPTGHGAKLLDWSYATEPNSRVVAISRPYEAYYAPEILNRDRVSTRADIYMAAGCAAVLMGASPGQWELPDTVPSEVRTFLGRCLARDPSRRPPNAWDLHEEFDKLLERTIGKPEYRPLTMPSDTLLAF